MLFGLFNERFKCHSVCQLRDLNVVRFCSIERFKCHSVLFNSEI